MAIGMLGILKAGGVYVPIDPSYPKDRADAMMRRCRSGSWSSAMSDIDETSRTGPESRGRLETDWILRRSRVHHVHVRVDR